MVASEQYKRKAGYDAGWDNPLIVLELGKTPRNQHVVGEEFYESHIGDAIAWLKDNATPRGTIDGTRNPGHVAKRTRAGYEVETATKDLDAGIAEVHKRLDLHPVQ